MKPKQPKKKQPKIVHQYIAGEDKDGNTYWWDDSTQSWVKKI